MNDNNTTDYDFRLCSSGCDLLEALRLRIEVFHKEQKFSMETEIDRYDPVSAHFLLVLKNDGKAVATLRLTPYPLPDSIITESHAIKDTVSNGIVTSDSDNLPSSDDFPLGRLQSIASLASQFLQTMKSQAPLKEVPGSPYMRGAKLGRLAVSKEMRGKGLGAIIVREAEAWLLRVLRCNECIEEGSENIIGEHTERNLQGLFMVISGQMQAKGFYEKLSYTVRGEPYDEEGEPHIWCIKQLVYDS